MNLPAHGTTSPDPSQHQCVQTTHAANTCSIIAWRSLSAVRRNACVDRLAGPPHRQAPGLSQIHCCRVYRLVEHTLPPGTMRCRDSLTGHIAW